MQSKLKGKLAFVTGSSRGVGQQIALGLAQLGADIIVHGREKSHLSKTLDLLAQFPVEVNWVEGDLTLNSEISGITNRIIDNFGGVDILYNNAAFMSSSKENIWKHTPEAWETTFQVNVYALYYMCASFIPGMIKRGYGRVINLTSGIKDQPELLPYSASKAAVDKLTRDIAVKLEGTGVRINYLDPGWLKTDMGGPNAWHPVEAVLPGALIPALIEDDGPNGQFFSAIELRNTQI
jgi:3-oxoacyl-[acyl-carrier protein] reductase